MFSRLLGIKQRTCSVGHSNELYDWLCHSTTTASLIEGPILQVRTCPFALSLQSKQRRASCIPRVRRGIASWGSGDRFFAGVWRHVTSTFASTLTYCVPSSLSCFIYREDSTELLLLPLEPNILSSNFVDILYGVECRSYFTLLPTLPKAPNLPMSKTQRIESLHLM